MEDVTITVDTEHADALRRQIASKCGTAAEELHGVADEYAMGAFALTDSDGDLSELHAALDETRLWGQLLDALGWEETNSADGRPHTLTAPQDELRDLLYSGLLSMAESFDEVEPSFRVGKRPSDVARRKIEDIKLFEDLLDRVGWPDPEGGG